MNKGSSFTKVMLISFSTEAVPSVGLGVGVAGGYSTNCIWGGSAPSSNPLPCYIPFLTEQLSPSPLPFLADSAVVKRLVYFYFFFFSRIWKNSASSSVSITWRQSRKLKPLINWMRQLSRNLFKKLLSGVPLNTKPKPLSTNCTLKVDFLKILFFLVRFAHF